jgi:uncharacterized protein
MRAIHSPIPFILRDCDPPAARLKGLDSSKLDTLRHRGNVRPASLLSQATTTHLAKPRNTENVIDPDLLSILACPLCDDRPPLREQGDYLVCSRGGHGYPVVDGIPHLLPEDAIAPEKMEELLRDQS